MPESLDTGELESYGVSGRLPNRVLIPDDEAEVVNALSEAREWGHAVIPVGGGTMLELGNVPERYDMALSTRALHGIVEYNPSDLTVIARAGTTLAELDEVLSAHGQFLPLGLGNRESATLGGTLSTNASGPWRTAYGSARDMVIGMRMALPDGQIARSGGRVVKNVAGYDLAKLFIGACGSLGVIVEVALKVFPYPSTVQTLRVPVADVESAVSVATALRRIDSGLLDLVLVTENWEAMPSVEGPSVVVVVGGTRNAAEELAQFVRRTSPGRVIQMEEEEAHTFHLKLSRKISVSTVRISASPSHAREIVSSLHDPFLWYPAVGMIFVQAPEWSAGEIHQMRQQVAPSGGSVVLLRPIPGVDAWGPLGPEMSLMRKVKDVFDPQRVMSPGRYAGGL